MNVWFNLYSTNLNVLARNAAFKITYTVPSCIVKLILVHQSTQQNILQPAGRGLTHTVRPVPVAPQSSEVRECKMLYALFTYFDDRTRSKYILATITKTKH